MQKRILSIPDIDERRIQSRHQLIDSSQIYVTNRKIYITVFGTKFHKTLIIKQRYVYFGTSDIQKQFATNLDLLFVHDLLSYNVFSKNQTFGKNAEGLVNFLIQKKENTIFSFYVCSYEDVFFSCE